MFSTAQSASERFEHILEVVSEKVAPLKVKTVSCCPPQQLHSICAVLSFAAKSSVCFCRLCTANVGCLPAEQASKTLVWTYDVVHAPYCKKTRPGPQLEVCIRELLQRSVNVELNKVTSPPLGGEVGRLGDKAQVPSAGILVCDMSYL